MKNMILPILFWTISFSQLFCQEPLASIQAHAVLCNDTNMQITDTTANSLTYANATIDQNLEIIEGSDENQMDATMADALFMFPNPTNGVVQVKLSGKVSIYIYNLSGQLIRRYYMSPGDKMLDLTELQEGMYQVRAKSDDDYFSGKLLVQ